MSDSKILDVFEVIRKTLLADSDTIDYLADHIHISHITNVDNPVYPALSMTLLPSTPDFAVTTMISMNIQVDLWFKSADYSWDDVFKCQALVKSALHRQRLSDTDIGITIGQIYEAGVGPQMYEQDTGLLHLPIRYEVVGYA